MGIHNWKSFSRHNAGSKLVHQGHLVAKWDVPEHCHFLILFGQDTLQAPIRLLNRLVTFL